MSSQLKILLPSTDYLAWSANRPLNTNIFGEVFAMAGAGNNHHIITSNLIGELHTFLKGRACAVYPK